MMEMAWFCGRTEGASEESTHVKAKTKASRPFRMVIPLKRIYIFMHRLYVRAASIFITAAGRCQQNGDKDPAGSIAEEEPFRSNGPSFGPHRADFCEDLRPRIKGIGAGRPGVIGYDPAIPDGKTGRSRPGGLKE